MAGSTREMSGRARSSPFSWASPIFIACLGLFGLAAFTASRRTREIGIRKVFGARDRDVVSCCCGSSRSGADRNLIAWPWPGITCSIGCKASHTRISLNPFYFIRRGTAALLIAC